MGMKKTGSDWEWEYRRKQTEKVLKLDEQAMQGKIDPDIYNLKSILLSIAPHSKWWRWGYMKSLKRAIKLLNENIKASNRKMLTQKEQTARGFDVYRFQDDYGAKCSLQESSSVEPHVWLGTDDAEPKIMYKDARSLGLDLQKLAPETGECGWCDYPIPDTVLLTTRMHLNRAQARELGWALINWSSKGQL